MNAKMNILPANNTVIYQPNALLKLDVKVYEDTVWLTQKQMVVLFQSSKANISEHLRNIFAQKELDYTSTVRIFRTVQKEGRRIVNRDLEHYNLDVIISLGFRVNTLVGIRFRQWANQVLQQLMRNNMYSEARLTHIENTLMTHDKQIKELVQTALPPKCGLFFDGQIFDAYVLMAKLIKTAKKDIKLIDNYIDESVLVLLDKRNDNVAATIFTQNTSPQLQLDIQRHNAQYHPIKARQMLGVHDRFMLIDDTQLYHIGASIKDLGKKLFAITLIEDTEIIAVMRKKIK